VISLQGMWGELNEDSTIGCPGVEEAAHAVITLLAILFFRFELDPSYANCLVYFRSLHHTSQESVDISLFEPVFNDLH